MCQSNVVDSVSGFAACVHIISTVRLGLFNSDVINCYDKSYHLRWFIATETSSVVFEVCIVDDVSVCYVVCRCLISFRLVSPKFDATIAFLGHWLISPIVLTISPGLLTKSSGL